jgi:SPT2 chromatin protein
MSFLDVLDSIETGQRPATPQPQERTSATAKGSRPLSNPTIAKLNSSVSHPPLGGSSSVPNGTKRKAEDAFRATSERPQQPLSKQGPSPGKGDRKLTANNHSHAASRDTLARIGSPASSAASAKVYPKGSYAALMAEARATQKTKAKSEVGLIKHQATPRERLSRSERKKREEEGKTLKAKLSKQPQHNSKVEKRAQFRPKQRQESSYKGTAKPAQPMSSYKGTAGLPSQHRPSSVQARHKAGKKTSRYDEYLGTDEEEEGDEIDASDMDDRYGSDVSSDMEAGVLDVEEEETRTLKEAKADDARELALETKLKQEKEERKRKLEALARKRR